MLTLISESSSLWLSNTPVFDPVSSITTALGSSPYTISFVSDPLVPNTPLSVKGNSGRSPVVIRIIRSWYY